MSQKYTVQEGDTFLSIAQDYGLSIYQIASFNKLETFQVTVGQVLLIPSPFEEALRNPEVIIPVIATILMFIISNNGFSK